MKVEKIKKKWLAFKASRKKNPGMSDKDKNFITMLKREKMIDILFKEIEGLYEQKRQQS